jgi:hypothetical protein
MRFDCMQMASVPCQMTNKLSTNVHHRDRRAAATVFTNGTYFLDTSSIILDRDMHTHFHICPKQFDSFC